MGRNTTGPPCSRGATIILETAWRHRLACAGWSRLQTRRRVLQTTDNDRRQRPLPVCPPPYTTCRRASNNVFWVKWEHANWTSISKLIVKWRTRRACWALPWQTFISRSALSHSLRRLNASSFWCHSSQMSCSSWPLPRPSSSCSRSSSWPYSSSNYQHHSHGNTAWLTMVTSNRATVTVFVTVWPWPLTFWPLGQCMPSDCYRVYVYQVWCW